MTDKLVFSMVTLILFVAAYFLFTGAYLTAILLFLSSMMILGKHAEKKKSDLKKV